MEPSHQDDIDFSLIIASTIHDMKNSLSMLLNSLEQTVNELSEEDPEKANRLALLQYEASRVNNDLIHLLGIYRVQKDRLLIHYDEVYLFDFLDEQIIKHEMLLSARNISCDLDCDDSVSGYFDDDLIGGVVGNIIVNAVRYTKEKILIRAYESNNMVVIELGDDGPGYPEEMLTDPAGNMKSIDFSSGSTCLGIYFADQVVKQHRNGETIGRIQIKNGGPLGGGVFSIFLP